MKKAIFIILLAALLSGCGNAADTNTETASPAQTTAVSHNTNISETAPEIKAVNVKISEEEKKTTTTTTTAETTSTSKTTTTTTKAETTTSGTTSKSTTRKTVSESTTTRQPAQQIETYVIYYDEPSPETQQTQPEARVTETESPTTTTVQTTLPTATATETIILNKIEWSDSMMVWRKLCEDQNLTDSEQDIIRNEILDYAVQTFNGKQDIHLSFGIDNFDISYEKPLNLTINRDLTSMENAHFDAYAVPDSKWLIDYATSEQEVYKIVCDTRESCLHIIDHGLFNRWEIFTINNSLKYASDIEFNVGFDEDMMIWFLTQD